MGHRRISTASTHTLRVSTLWHRLGLHLPRPEVNVGLPHPSWHASASCGAVRRGRHSWQSGAARRASRQIALGACCRCPVFGPQRALTLVATSTRGFPLRPRSAHASPWSTPRARGSSRRTRRIAVVKLPGGSRKHSSKRVSTEPGPVHQAGACVARWLRTVRRECLDWMPICGRRHLEKVLAEVRRPRHCQAAPSWPRPARARHQGKSTRRGQIERASTAERRAWRTDPRA